MAWTEAARQAALEARRRNARIPLKSRNTGKSRAEQISDNRMQAYHKKELERYIKETAKYNAKYYAKHGYNVAHYAGIGAGFSNAPTKTAPTRHGLRNTEKAIGAGNFYRRMTGGK